MHTWLERLSVNPFVAVQVEQKLCPQRGVCRRRTKSEHEQQMGLESQDWKTQDASKPSIIIDWAPYCLNGFYYLLVPIQNAY